MSIVCAVILGPLLYICKQRYCFLHSYTIFKPIYDDTSLNGQHYTATDVSADRATSTCCNENYFFWLLNCTTTTMVKLSLLSSGKTIPAAINTNDELGAAKRMERTSMVNFFYFGYFLTLKIPYFFSHASLHFNNKQRAASSTTT